MSTYAPPRANEPTAEGGGGTLSLNRDHASCLRLRLVWIALHFPQIKGGPFQERRNQKSPGQNKITKKFLNHMACLRKTYLFIPQKPSLYSQEPSHSKNKQPTNLNTDRLLGADANQNFTLRIFFSHSS